MDIDCVMGDLREWTGDRVRVDIPGIQMEYDNGRRRIDFGAAWFQAQKVLHKYTMVARGQDIVNVMSMIDMVVVKRNMFKYVQNVKTMRGIGLSEHHVEKRGEQMERTVVEGAREVCGLVLEEEKNQPK